ncbi:hypothetical protein HJ01_03490 [Flavobacterium frigoris PS1]|uniref:Uncharacterized protein n=1 Tax=Flavobacterium frigoris (strain PS1) TaxID=1086011 RepID=H7FWE3_FLAFP|nr:hypothetical protein HJ01_03490 [Flavobacterium frigoris PS1]
MKTAVSITRYFGSFILLVGISLNVKMYFFNERPTYMFTILSFFGALLIGISYLMKPKVKSK